MRSMEDIGGASEWINADENAKTMLARVLANRQSCVALTRHIPPLMRVPLRAGNVVEIVGPSSSAKSELLIQAAVNCILPKEWKGVRYGGSEGVVMLFDLDCRFDVMRLARCLQYRIHGTCGPRIDHNMYSGKEIRSNDKQCSQASSLTPIYLEDELFVSCMERLLYIRCYNSFEFLAALKTIRPKLQKAIEKHSNGVHLLMIDSISAFYWLDRALKSASIDNNASRKSLSLQVVSEAVVQELRNLLQINPMLVLVTKPTIYSRGPSEILAGREGRKWSKSYPETSKHGNQVSEKNLHREYMPAVWQAFVTHRLLLGRSDDTSDNESIEVPVYTSEWERPSLQHLDRFIVQDVRTQLLLHSSQFAVPFCCAMLVCLRTFRESFLRINIGITRGVFHLLCEVVRGEKEFLRIPELNLDASYTF